MSPAKAGLFCRYIQKWIDLGDAHLGVSLPRNSNDVDEKTGEPDPAAGKFF